MKRRRKGQIIFNADAIDLRLHFLPLLLYKIIQLHKVSKGIR